jgi:hypothetical protein
MAETNLNVHWFENLNSNILPRYILLSVYLYTYWFKVRSCKKRWMIVLNAADNYDSLTEYMPITVAARSTALPVSTSRTLGSRVRIPFKVCIIVCLFCVYVSSGLATGWSPIQGILLTVLRLRNSSETKRFTDALCSKWEEQEYNKKKDTTNCWIKKSTRQHHYHHQWLYSPSLGPGLFFSFVFFYTQAVGLFWRGISPSKGRHLHTGQHKHRYIHALSGIRTHDPSVHAREDSSYLGTRGHCHLATPQQPTNIYVVIFQVRAVASFEARK